MPSSARGSAAHAVHQVRDRLFESAGAGVERHAEGVELLVEPSGADAEHEAPVGELDGGNDLRGGEGVARGSR